MLKRSKCGIVILSIFDTPLRYLLIFLAVLDSPQCPTLRQLIFAAFLLKAVLKTESNDRTVLVTSNSKLLHTDRFPFHD